MFSKNNFILLFILFFNFSSAQIKINASYGYNFDFGEKVSSVYKSISNIDLKLRYSNKTRFEPFIAISFSQIPLNYSDQIITNQQDFKTVIINKSSNLQLGIFTIIKDFDELKFLAKFGFGLSLLSEPSVWIENSNTGFGYNSKYINNTETNFAFVDLAISLERGISDSWSINFDLGSNFYPKENSISVNSKINGSEIFVNSSFSRLRPYVQIGLLYDFQKK